MKNFNLSLFLGCCTISIGIIITGNLIAERLPQVVSGTFSGTMITEPNQQFGEYLSVAEASAYIRMNYDDFDKFIQSGELKGTYTAIRGNDLFSKEKLSEWLENRIKNE